MRDRVGPASPRNSTRSEERTVPTQPKNHILYVVAFGIYLASWLLRKRQGIDMAMVHNEIPVE